MEDELIYILRTEPSFNAQRNRCGCFFDDWHLRLHPPHKGRVFHHTNFCCFAMLGMMLTLVSTHLTANSLNPATIGNDASTKHSGVHHTIREHHALLNTNHRYPNASLSNLPVLTEEHGFYTIFDVNLQEHTFQESKNGEYRALTNSSGTLNRLSSTRHQWTDGSGEKYQFEGSVLANTVQLSISLPASSYSVENVSKSNNLLTHADALANSRKQISTNIRSVATECRPVNTSAPDKPVDTPESDSAGSTQASDDSTIATPEAPTNTTTPPAQTGDTTTNPVTPTTPDQPIDQTNQPEPEPEPEEPDEPEEQCDTSTAGSHTFDTITYNGAHTTIDARPVSCQSYFVEFYGTQRGSQIETGLFLHPPYSNMTATNRVFPVIDFIDDSGLYVVKSRDLGNRTFNSTTNPDALLDQLLSDGEEIQTRFIDVLDAEGSITAGELGQSTTINSSDIRPVTLQLIIRDGMASPAHWQQIETAREQLMSLYGVSLEVIVIP